MSQQTPFTVPITSSTPDAPASRAERTANAAAARTPRRRARLAGLVAVAAIVPSLALAGCGQSSTPEDERTVAASSSSGAAAHATAAPATGDNGATLPTASGEYNTADAMFAEMMKVHHEQAITLSDLVLAKPGLDPEVKTLAEQIKKAQGPEIEQMRGWLSGWGVAEGSMGDHSMHMDGMVAQADLDKIEAADTKEAARLFLTHMIAHHEGAVDMAKDELSGGKNPEAMALAQQIIDTQQKEIDHMKELLKK